VCAEWRIYVVHMLGSFSHIGGVGLLRGARFFAELCGSCTVAAVIGVGAALAEFHPFTARRAAIY
jgi:hypothetical protein